MHFFTSLLIKYIIYQRYFLLLNQHWPVNLVNINKHANCSKSSETALNSKKKSQHRLVVPTVGRGTQKQHFKSKNLKNGHDMPDLSLENPLLLI